MAKRDDKDFELIRRRLFSEEGESIVLSDDQQTQLNRWNFAIELRTCDQYYTKAIVKRLMEKFNIERATAYNDIGYAEALFGYSHTLNKRFRIGARIDYLEEQIRKMYQLKHYTEAAMLEKVLQAYYADYPDVKHSAPRTLVFSYDGDEPLKEDLPNVDQAEYILIEAVRKNG